MKSILLASFFMISSSSSFANDYLRQSISCTLGASKTSISDSSVKNFDQKYFTINVVSVLGTRKIVKIVADGESLLNLPQIKIPMFVFLNNGPADLVIDFDDLSVKESMDLLKSLGETNVPTLPKGFEIEQIRLLKGDWSSVRSQVHFDSKVKDGLAYHLTLKCFLGNID